MYRMRIANALRRGLALFIESNYSLVGYIHWVNNDIEFFDITDCHPSVKMVSVTCPQESLYAVIFFIVYAASNIIVETDLSRKLNVQHI